MAFAIVCRADESGAGIGGWEGVQVGEPNSGLVDPAGQEENDDVVEHLVAAGGEYLAPELGDPRADPGAATEEPAGGMVADKGEGTVGVGSVDGVAYRASDVVVLLVPARGGGVQRLDPVGISCRQPAS